VGPDRKIRPLLQHLRAARQERAHRQRQDLIEGGIRRAGGGRRGNRGVANPGGGVALGHAAIPRANDLGQLGVASNRLHLFVVAVVERAVAAQDIGGLPNHQAKVGRLEWDLLEAEDRPRVRVAAGENVRAQFERGKRDSSLDTAVQLEKFEVHRHRVGELRLPLGDRPQLHHLPRLGSRRADGAIVWLSHEAIIMETMRILMVASETLPFAKTGGLADVLGALPPALARLGHIVDVIIPRYRGIAAGEPAGSLRVPLGGQVAEASMSAVAADGVRTLFVGHAPYFDRDYLYGAGGHDYPDNPERFAFLARAAVEWAATRREPYDVIHAHDWQSGLVPVFETRIPTVFTIHNLAYQGVFDASWLLRLGLGWDLMHIDALEFWGRVSYLKGGINFSRMITTVSPRYAAEIQTPEYGAGFDGILRQRASDLVGILNGIDYDQWDPARDPHLPTPFAASNLEGKQQAKRAVLKEYGLPVTPESLERPLAGMVSRLVDQKGFDLIAELAEELPRLDASFVLLGTGDRRYEDLWLGLAARHPARIGARIGFDERMAHLIEGGSDLFLMPSRFEPCGLNQMYSLRYGTVPLVRATGGLHDTVQNFDARTGRGTGFTFDEYSAEALLGTLRWALGIYKDKAAWRTIQSAGMKQDFTWDASARQYERVYERAKAWHPTR
jgi:starch synthase